MELHHRFPEIAHRHPGLDHQRIDGEPRDALQRHQRIAQVIQHAQEKHDIEPPDPLRSQLRQVGIDHPQRWREVPLYQVDAAPVPPGVMPDEVIDGGDPRTSSRGLQAVGTVPAADVE
jgi:hypothetical protein